MLGYRPGRHARPPWRAPRPHNYERPAGRAAHHAVGMKSDLGSSDPRNPGQGPRGRPDRARVLAAALLPDEILSFRYAADVLCFSRV